MAHKLPPSWYRIILNQTIQCNYRLQMEHLLNHLFPDEDLQLPNCINHLVFCAFSNDHIDTTELEVWIEEQHERLMVNPFQWCLIDDSFFLNLRSFLTLQDEARFREVCKFNNFICDMSDTWCGQLDCHYRSWLALSYNKDCLKDQFLKNMTMHDLHQLIVFDVRALSVAEIQEMSKSLLENVVINQVKKHKHKLQELTFNREFFGMLAQFMDKQSYFQLILVNCLWLAMFGSARVLSKLQWNKCICFNDHHFRAWNTTGSTWYYYSGAHYMVCDIDHVTRFLFHPAHVSKFVGFGLRIFEGTYVPFNFSKCQLWGLRWCSLQLSSTNKIDRSWNALAYDLHFCDIFLDFLFVRGFEDFDLSLFVPAKCIIFYHGAVNPHTIYRCIMRGKYKRCILWELRITEGPPDHDWIDGEFPSAGEESDLILYHCVDVFPFIYWVDMAWYIKSLTWIERYRYLTENDFEFMREMMVLEAPATYLQDLTIFFWDKIMPDQIPIWDKIISQNPCNDLLATLTRNLQQIKKKSEWEQIKCGVDISVGDQYYNSHIVKVSELRTKLHIRQERKSLDKVCNWHSKPAPNVHDVRDLWQENVQKWWKLPTDVSSDSDIE